MAIRPALGLSRPAPGSSDPEQLNALEARVAGMEAAIRTPFQIPAHAITFGGHILVSHPLGYEPTKWKLKLRCKSAGLGFSVGHVIAAPEVADGYSSSTGVSVRVDSTTIRINIGTAGFWLIRDDTKAAALAVASQWELFGEVE